MLHYSLSVNPNKPNSSVDSVIQHTCYAVIALKPDCRDG